MYYAKGTSIYYAAPKYDVGRHYWHEAETLVDLAKAMKGDTAELVEIINWRGDKVGELSPVGLRRFNNMVAWEYVEDDEFEENYQARVGD